MTPYPPAAPTPSFSIGPPTSISRVSPSPSITHLSSTGFNGWIALIIVCLLLGTGLILLLAGRARRGSTH